MQKLIGKLSHKLGQMKLAKFIQRKVFFRKFLTNLEKREDFYFYLPYENKKNGVSAFIRMKNEEQKIFYCLKSIIDVFDEIVLIDNNSQDKSLEIVNEFKEKYDRYNKIKILTYPFNISRCGSEHNDTPGNSVHSLAYYYNYTLSHCFFKFACKWDADMVLIKENKEDVRKFFQEINYQNLKVWKLTGKTLYRDLNKNYYLANDQVFSEQRLFPCSYFNRYVKGDLFEKFVSQLPRDQFSKQVFYELKFANEDEFSNWSTTNFQEMGRQRKTKEWETMESIKNNQINPEKLTPLSDDFLL